LDIHPLALAQEREAAKKQQQHINDTLDALLGEVRKLQKQVASLEAKLKQEA
jgi:predicted  nucleic acid-binding Zn-ribbon protein